ncbi:hypothetical protein RN001_009600 [Aquatica leii]|uniref:Glutathione S-transferase n=1 Tax=Aquatica leii TaxID=1421715 RepID=A0AAN7SFQ2_9COLE|nr:hypothetical protein RN001_009600 [Aquatica leii]
MAPKLYIHKSSAVVRSVLLNEAALGLSLEHVPINLFKGEHLTPEFLELNPLHTIPTLVDGDKVIFDSAAINIYLVEQYGKGSSLYPNDPYEKALVNELLHFASSFFITAARIIKPIMLKGVKEIFSADTNEMINVYGYLEKLLEGRVWATGDKLTLADFALIPLVTSAHIAVPIDENKFPNITAWLNRAKQLPYYHCNAEGNEEFKTQFLERLHSKS